MIFLFCEEKGKRVLVETFGISSIIIAKEEMAVSVTSF